MSEVNLKVAEAKQRDAGRGMARIDDVTMRALNITVGDAISIKGKKITAAIALPAHPEDADERDIIRLDNLTRKNAVVVLNEYVTVKKAEVKDAQSIILAPNDMNIDVDQLFINFVKSRLSDIPLVKDDSIRVVILGSVMLFTVVGTRPDGILKVTSDTYLQILNKQFKEKMFHRFAWLKMKEKECGSDYTRFCISDILTDEKEEVVIAEAKKLAENNNKSITIQVEFWEKRGKIDSVPWAIVIPEGLIEYVYKPPTSEIQELEKDVKRLDDEIHRLQVGGGIAGAREPRIVTVEDWYSHEMIQIDEDEVFRLKLLLYDRISIVHPKYLVISPVSQLKTYGRTTSGMIKSALLDKLISVAQIRQVGLDPKDYGITK